MLDSVRGTMELPSQYSVLGVLQDSNQRPKNIHYAMGGASGVAGGICPLFPAMPCPRISPVVVRKNYIALIGPSRPLSQRTVYVKIHEMCHTA